MRYLKTFEELDVETYRSFYDDISNLGFSHRAKNALDVIWDKLIKKYYKPDHCIEYVVNNEELKEMGYKTVMGYPILEYNESPIDENKFEFEYSIHFEDKKLRDILSEMEEDELDDHYMITNDMLVLGTFYFTIDIYEENYFISLDDFSTSEDPWFEVKEISDFYKVIDHIFKDSTNYNSNFFRELWNQNQDINDNFDELTEGELTHDDVRNAFHGVKLDYV